MVYALLTCLSLNCILGLLAYSASQQLGPFQASIPDEWEETLIYWHIRLGHATAILVLGHLAGVLWAARLHRENYALGMLTGLRRIPRAMPVPDGAKHPEQASPRSEVVQRTLNWLNFRHPFVGTLILMAMLLGIGLLIIEYLVDLNRLLPAY